MSHQVTIGSVHLGGAHRVKIQSMCNTDTENVSATVAQIRALQKEGCELIRVAVPTMASAKALSKIKKRIKIPLIADIHFNPELAIAAIKNGADKIRINPGNIADKKALKEIIALAVQKKVAIRIGVNEGSLEQDLMETYGPHSGEALAISALRWVEFFEKNKFKKIVISVKSSDVLTTIKANRILDEKCDYPIHLGVTEAGTVETGTIKSAIGIGTLLADGIGSTIRVSLSADPIEEIRVAKKILDALDIIKLPLRVIACPTCGRTKSDVPSLAREIESSLKPKKPLTIAVLGCGVNVKGESQSADYAIIPAEGDNFTLFRKNRPVLKNKPKQQIINFLKKENS
ncbi:MAG: 4-hydroxy-3-methylbut-2-en-1-yl diphosphate synthase [uncultured bacterium]|nr:MAG: 4-hydroxy-3-methylbut-2-en-1-yl diphosphate synthase [uncultured bacterium]OGJ48191.1 MAG: 4-hydroxy-3-methylbut-2-en-1-yl diphosphate synthase [Candidatus Peregrinibacteria bacterium RIFOXYB12_FULL_41_12]OGJ48303.1 MAG: 4-hydroxy-3-methylbut-2-en-1-yl diphosphate synthase [Candidatus Peregrinibacteria bacterium RIFOXYA2_FULL_41_18]OGJ53455.1 MAG: 4-hydroxy-3-methylbut-2-en-1-yl diphosphate synthase [Candidatus Peregrinibacteria bacterium RIFOXYC2_FULL_41_22]OGJ54304.1 MAG: 4-hydroxy-3-